MAITAKKTSVLPAHTGAGRPLSSRPSGPGTAFANFLIDYLPNLAMTNEQISSELGYSRPNIVSMWKTAKTKVTLDALFGLSKLLKVDLAYLLALYFEQYTDTSMGGANQFPELAKMMGRVATPEEWEIIQTVREARKHNSVPLKGSQRSELKKLFKLDGVTEEGPLREIELNFSSTGDRRTFSRRGHGRDMSISEIDEANARTAAKTGPAKSIKAGKSAASSS